MTRILSLTAAALAALLSPGDAMAQTSGHAVPPGQAATSMRNAQGQVVGEAAAVRDGAVVRMRVTVRGFTPGTYAVHIHDTGRCEGPGFESAGPHWNPAGKQHGRLNPRGPHLGDLPNLEVRANGTGRIDFEVRIPPGTAGGSNPLLDADGSSVVIHAAADDERTDPSGNSGARIACGVLRQVR